MMAKIKLYKNVLLSSTLKIDTAPLTIAVYFAVECQVEFDYEAELPDELSIRTGEVITAVKQMEGGWWEGTCKGKRGLFPDNFVKVRQGKPLIGWYTFVD